MSLKLTQACATARPPAAPAPTAFNGATPRDILSSIRTSVYDWNMISDEISWGPNLCEVLPVANPADLSSGRAFAGLMTLNSAHSRREFIERAAVEDAGAGAHYRLEYCLTLDPNARGATQLRIEETGRCYIGCDGRPVRAHGALRVIANAQDMSPVAVATDRIDILTGALTRRALTTCVNRLFSEARPGQRGFALVLLAINDLAMFNRRHGYEAGDALIAAVAGKIRECMRANDVFARYSGNRFALLLQNCDSGHLPLAAARFLDAITLGELRTPAGDFTISMRAGGLSAPQQAHGTQQLFENVEEAIDAAHRQSARFVAYSPGLAANSERWRQRTVSDQIIEALNERRVSIVLQPIVAARTGKPVFYEAQLRLRTAQGHDIAPASVIPVAEQTGLVTLLDLRVLELALDCLATDPALTLSVNISGKTAQDVHWLEILRMRLAQRPDFASRLIVEITETYAMGDIGVMRERIALMRETGIRVAMDDFGAGHSSFRNLRGLGIDMLKIDGVFIQSLARSPDDRFFVRKLIELARHLAIPVVAEWVEDSETAMLLAEWGVDYCQGSWCGMGREIGALQHAGDGMRAA